MFADEAFLKNETQAVEGLEPTSSLGLSLSVIQECAMLLIISTAVVF